MSSLTIICPNARRVQVKTTPTMLIRQVLEEACLKSGFEVSHHRLQTQSGKPVDASLPFRLTGISNNATLEMIKMNGEILKSTSVDLAIQVESGARKQRKVGVNEPLFEVLRGFTEFDEDLTEQKDGTVPSIIYMNKRYSGIAELSKNSLASLGVTSGKCLMRYLRVKMTEEQILEMEMKQKEEEMKKKALDANFEKLKAENEEREMIEKKRQEDFEREKEQREIRERKEQEQRAQDAQNALAQTHEEPAPIQRDVLRDVPQQDPNAWSFDGAAFSRPAHQNTMRLEELNRLLERVDNSLEPSGIGMDAMVNALADGGRISLAEVKARADEAMETEQEVLAEPCDRQAVVFQKIARPVLHEPMETEEFFEVGLDDVRNMQKDLRKAVRDQNQASFVSKAYLLKKNRELKMEAWPKCVIRFNIGKFVLQACFNSGEPSSNLELFLKSVLIRSGWKLMFTNRQVTLSETKNFVDLELAPKSTLVLSFGAHGAPEHGEVLQNVAEVSPESADAISQQWLAGNKTFVPFCATTNEEKTQKRATMGSSMGSSPPAKSAMPKWMQTKK